MAEDLSLSFFKLLVIRFSLARAARLSVFFRFSQISQVFRSWLNQAETSRAGEKLRRPAVERQTEQGCHNVVTKTRPHEICRIHISKTDEIDNVIMIMYSDV